VSGLPEQIWTTWAGTKAAIPIRVGNATYLQRQHHVWAQYSTRCLCMPGPASRCLKRYGGSSSHTCQSVCYAGSSPAATLLRLLNPG
jgi:hypothetical protein